MTRPANRSPTHGSAKVCEQLLKQPRGLLPFPRYAAAGSRAPIPLLPVSLVARLTVVVGMSQYSLGLVAEIN
jgi:hypothetical protein